MCVSTYPFFRDVAATTGRLLGLQGSITLSQIIRRMAETWGERSTVTRASQRIIRSMILWGVLVEAKGKGVFTAAQRLKVKSGDAIGPWLVEASISNCAQQARPLSSLRSNAVLFPLELEVSVREVASNGRLEIHRQGLDEDIVKLTGVR